MFGRDDTQTQPTDTQVPLQTPALMSDPMPDFASLSMPQDPSAVNTAPVPSMPLGTLTPPDPMPSLPSVNAPAQIPEPVEAASHEDTLLAIKQEAMQHLTPLVSHLEQTPEEKFRTTMMMIQASDNQGLVKDAFEAAKQITDDKARAQALLDVINEINYFTQQHA